MMSDLQAAFDFYEKLQGLNVISIDHFINVLKNFGFHKEDKKKTDAECIKVDPDFLKRTGVEFNFLKIVVAHKWNKVASGTSITGA